MTTAIRDSYAALDSALIGRSGQGVYVGIDKTSLPHRADVIIPRDEFLAAVAAELDVIVINRSDLPEVSLHTAHGRGLLGHTTSAQVADFDYGNQGHTEPVPVGYSPNELIALGIALKENPPVDEAQVDALAKVLADVGPSTEGLARRLVAAGVRAPQAGDDQ